MASSLKQTWWYKAIKQYFWAPALVFIFHAIAAKGFDAYTVWPDLDIPMHFFGGFVISYFYNGIYKQAERHQLLGQPAVFLRVITVFALASTTTILWEFSEFMCDLVLGTSQQTSLPDTMLDMFLGMIGAVVLLALVGKRRSSHI